MERNLLSLLSMHACARVALTGCLLGALASACAAPALSQDGQLVFSQGGQHGATILTANGVEFVDRAERPHAVVRRSAFEAWRPPTGFLLPRDGVLRETSRPVPIDGQDVLVVLRASDALVPSWGGEVLVRLDALVPPKAHPESSATRRPPARVALVLDADGRGALPLVDTLLDAVGALDRVSVIDATGGEVVVPAVPGSHHTLLEGAVERRLLEHARSGSSRDLTHALEVAARELGTRGERRLLVVSDGRGVSEGRAGARREAARLSANGVVLSAVGANERVDHALLEPLGASVGVGADEARQAVVEALLAPPGDVVLRDLTLAFSSAPAPLRLLESSSGEITTTLEDEQLDLGDMMVGEARTEVVRLGVPEWQAGDEYRLRVAASWRDETGRWRSARREIRMLYADDIEAIARQRRGDVIAYASALAMVRRLERAFLGSEADRLGGIEGLVRWQSRSLGVLARSRHDRWLAGEVEVLDALLDALGPG